MQIRAHIVDMVLSLLRIAQYQRRMSHINSPPPNSGDDNDSDNNDNDNVL